MTSNFFSKNRVNLFLLVGLVAYNDLFYHEQLGLNVLLFTIIILVILFILFPSNIKTVKSLGSAALTILTAVMVVWHNSMLSCWMYFISFLTTIGFIIQPALRFPGYAGLAALDNIIKVPREIFYWNRQPGASKKIRLTRMFTISIVPVVIALIFFMIYRAANPIFADLSNRFFEMFGKWFEDFFDSISWGWLIFIIGGVFLISGIVYHRRPMRILKEEENFSDTIARRKKMIRMPFMSMEFKNEFNGGVLLLVLMNLMLLALNLIDINYIWISFRIPEGVSLTEMVHQGTEWLIASIVLSMLLLIWLFRGNQNYYSRSGLLKYLAYAWIAQNMLLAISLLLRNNQYIVWHALAYKRLGVYVFIFLTFCGLITMLIKIWKAKSFFYLLRVNSWISYIVLCSICVVNWDVFIAKYNIESNKGEGLDTDFFLELSPKVLPYLYQDFEKIAAQIKAHPQDEFNHLTYKTPEDFREALDRRRDRYLANSRTNTFRSYNKADDFALKFLDGNAK